MKFRIRGLMAAACALLATTASAQDQADLELWRLDCGTIDLSDTGPFSDTHLYDGEKRTLTDSCYLVRHGEQYLLWDTGLPGALKGQKMTQGVFTVSVERTIVEQLADLGLTPADITFVGVSHNHFDHIGQTADFPASELLIGAKDAAMLESGKMEDLRVHLSPWLGEAAEGKINRIEGDHDVFGDGSVVMQSMPGHTPSHHSLLVRLPESGDVMLTGDLYHFAEQVGNRGVPQFNSDRADTLASMARFDQMADVLDAMVVIQHDPRHIQRLPVFPESAK